MNSPGVVSVLQDPDATLDYTFDWSHWLKTGDTISASTWASSNVNMVLASDSFTTTTTTIWIHFGALAEEGDQYEAVNTITTAGGRTDDRTIFVKVETQ